MKTSSSTVLTIQIDKLHKKASKHLFKKMESFFTWAKFLAMFKIKHSKY